MVKVVEIDGVRYEAEENNVRDPVKIVVLDRGWIVVGRYRKENEYIYVSDAAVIRRWGTTNGLGELAEKGPKNLSECILDKCLDVTAHELNIIMIMDCNHENWS